MHTAQRTGVYLTTIVVAIKINFQPSFKPGGIIMIFKVLSKMIEIPFRNVNNGHVKCKRALGQLDSPDLYGLTCGQGDRTIICSGNSYAV